LNFPLGYNSDGKKIDKSILTVSHLFVSYTTQPQIRDFLKRLSINNENDHTQWLEICRESNRLSFPQGTSMESYVYDNPSCGSILSKEKLFTSPLRLLKKRQNQKKLSQETLIILIDDIWQVMPGLNKMNSNWLKTILMDGAEQQIYFVIGSNFPYRNLLLQLMQPGSKKNSPVNELGAEIIINPDQLLFFREMNELAFEIFYPENTE
jgi:hypothetical protein